LRAYGKLTGDCSSQERADVQTGLKMILNLCLTDGFDMFPSLLVTDGSCMIDRRMGIHGHPLEIQVSLTMLCFFILMLFLLFLRLKLNNSLYYTVEIVSCSIDICYFSAYASTDINLYLLNKDTTLNSGNVVSALHF